MALEALASGVPVIGADAGGIPESLRHGLTGFLVPAGDAAAFAERVVELAVEDGAADGDGRGGAGLRGGARLVA